MSENRKNAIELSDEELDAVSGGKAVIFAYDGSRVQQVYECSQKVSGTSFKSIVSSGSNSCSHFSARSAGSQSCANCENYNHYGLLDTDVDERKSKFSSMGYDVVSIDTRPSYRGAPK